MNYSDHETVFSPIRLLGICFVIVIGNGCATYHPLPLTSQAATQQLAPPDMAEVRVLAEQIQHPILKPIFFDDRDGLSPDEAAILAVIANPDLRAVRDRKNIANAQLLQSGILPNPQLSYSFESPIGGDTSDSVNAFGLGLDWQVTSLLTHKLRKDAAKGNAASVDLEVAWQEWQVAEATKLHLYRLVVADQQYTLAKQVESNSEEVRILTTKGIELGEKTARDLAVADAAWEEAKLAALATQQDKECERLALNQVLGLPAGAVVPLQQNIILPSLADIPPADEMTDGIEKTRLDLLALKIGYDSQEARLRAAVRSQFPRINLGLSGGRDTENVHTVGFGLTLELPFFDHNQGRIALEQATRQQLFDEYLARLFAARSEIARILVDIKAIRKRIKTIEESLQTSERLVNSYQKAVQDGNAEKVSYYHALHLSYTKRLDLLRLKRQLGDLGIALEIATGKILPAAGSSALGSK